MEERRPLSHPPPIASIDRLLGDVHCPKKGAIDRFRRVDVLYEKGGVDGQREFLEIIDMLCDVVGLVPVNNDQWNAMCRNLSQKVKSMRLDYI